MSSERRSSRKRVPTLRGQNQVASKRPRQNQPAEVPPAADGVAPTPVTQLPQTVINNIVQEVADVVTQRLAAMSNLPAQNQPPTTSTCAVVPSLTEAPLAPTPANVPAVSSLPVDAVVSNAVASAQSVLTGMGQGVELASQERPATLFSSPSLDIDSRVSEKLRAKIWNNEYFDISQLLSSSSLEDKFQLTINNAEGSNTPAIFLEPVARSKKSLSIESWLNCFHVFVGVYCRKYPSEATALMKYAEVVQDLAARGSNWKFYDENFRFLRQSQPQVFTWGCTHWELWMRSQRYNSAKSAQSATQSSRPDKPPFGYCFKFSKGAECNGCKYKHLCYKCEGQHAPQKCNFRGQSKGPKQNSQHAASQASTASSK